MKKIKILVQVTLMCVALSGCTNNSLSYNVAALERFVKNKLFGPESINLMEPNLEVPASCKPPLASEQNKIAFVHFRGRVNRCVHLINQNPQLNNFFEVKNCIDQIGESFNLVTDTTCKNTVLVPNATGNAISIMDLMLSRFYSAHVVTLENGNTVFKWDKLTDYFSLVSRWYHQTRNSMYPLEETKIISNVQAIDFEVKINRKIWNDLQSYSQEWRTTFGEVVKPISPTNEDGSIRTPEQLQALRLEKNINFQIFETMLTVNKKVLDRAFASELSQDSTRWTDSSTTLAPSPLLAGIIGESLDPFFQRVRVIAKIYDIACKLKGCDQSFYQNNMTYWFLKYFHSIAVNQTLDTLPFDESDTVKPLPQFLTSINQNRLTIKKMSEALAITLNVPNVATSVAGVDLPQFLSPYKKAFEESYDLITNYENTKRTLDNGSQLAGFFVSKGVQEVNVGFSKLNMDRHIQNVKDANERLTSLSESFNSQKHTIIQKALDINSSALKMKDIENNINIEITEMLNQKNAMDAIRNFIYEGRVKYSEQVKSIVNDPTYSGNDKNFILNSSEIFNVLASATSTGTSPDSIDNTFLKVLDSEHTYKKGDLLQIAVNGEWSPTCAVSSTYGEQLRFAKATSRGFSLIESNGKSVVQSTSNYKTKESFSSVGASVEACGGFNWNSNPNRAFGWFSQVKLCANSAVGSRTSNGTTTSDNTSTSNRSDASFDLGLGLDNTPFTQLASGSLLLVEMPRGNKIKREARNIVVLNSTNSIILTNNDSDYYLIGNDCSSSNNTGQLSVSVSHLEPQGIKATQFISKIGSVMGEIENQVKGLISEGQLNYQVIETLKLQLKSIGGDTSDFNGQMRNLLDSLISSETSVLSYKSQLVVMERELEIKKKKILSLLDQYTAEDEAKFLKVDTRNWLLSNLDLDFVNGPSENRNLYTLNRILNTMENSLVSYVDFKYRNDDKAAILGNVSLLQDLQFSDSFETIAKRITSYTRILLDNLSDDLNNKPIIPKTTIGIRIPNPFYEPTFPVPYPSTSLHPSMEPTRAREFWVKLKNWQNPLDKQDLKMDVLIDDLYTQNGLGCYVQAPIIESWGMVFIPENEGYISDFNNNYRYKNAKVQLEGPSVIPYETQPINYNFVGSNWRFMDVAVRMAKNPNDAMRALTAEFPPEVERETGLATGRPIFGRFKIGDLRPWRRDNGEVFIGETPINEIKEVFLGYVITASNADFNVNMNWINYCAN